MVYNHCEEEREKLAEKAWTGLNAVEDPCLFALRGGPALCEPAPWDKPVNI